MLLRRKYCLFLLLVTALGAGCDHDRDGFGPRRDCNNRDSNSYPGAAETCDGNDNDCNGRVDDVDGVTAGFLVWYDSDGDGATGTQRISCNTSLRSVRRTDCDDNNSQIHPGALERCDGIDNNCNGFIDVDSTVGVWWPDRDGDGVAGIGATRGFCEPLANTSQTMGDCDDLDANRSPLVAEICNGIDENCNFVIDDVPRGCL